jgi:hypothetical protein
VKSAGAIHVGEETTIVLTTGDRRGFLTGGKTLGGRTEVGQSSREGRHTCGAAIFGIAGLPRRPEGGDVLGWPSQRSQ